ncbi:PDZ domain-containing protein [candidate division GN15 bacterium]|nr:PDZ domain-containing protein [candidate division GN15 bacterium]
MVKPVRYYLLLSALAILLSLPVGPRTAAAIAQDFDFGRLEQEIEKYTLVMEMKIELSFGMQSTEQELRMMATVVSEDGLVIFDGSMLELSDPFSSFSSFSVKSTPTRLEFTTLDGEQTYEGEYIGTDRYTRIGFARIVDTADTDFDYVEFSEPDRLSVGDWVALYFLLPEYVSPRLAADIGMVSTMVEIPEEFPMIVGFGPHEMTSVLFDQNLRPLGVLGVLPDPSASSADGGGMHSMGNNDFPMLGLIGADKIGELIADPPVKGQIVRGWLGITLQALTSDIQEFFGLEADGGIIVNEVMSDSPADKAGLKVGDLIVQVNGQPIEVDTEEKLPVFQRMIAEMGPDAPVEFTIVRPGEEAVDTTTVTAVLGKAPIAATDAEEYENDKLEFKVRDLVFTDYMLYNVDAETFTGVVVSELEPGGLATIGGLRIGDVIQRIGPYEISTVGDAEEALETLLADDPTEIVFFIWRNNKTMFVNVKTE